MFYTAMFYTTTATLLAVGFTLYAMGRAGSLRGKHNIVPPAVTGSPEYEIAARVHGNTVEQLVMFLPMLWLAAPGIGDMWAGLAGLVWFAGRILYARAMGSDPSKRGPGMMLTFLPTVALFLAVVVALVLEKL